MSLKTDMACRNKILLLYLLLLSGFSSCTNKSENKKETDQGYNDSTSETTSQIADSIAVSEYDEEFDADEQDSVEEYSVPFDTVQQANVQPFDKNKWNIKIEAIDYSEKHFEKKTKTKNAARVPFDFSGWGKILLAFLVIGSLAFLIWRLMAAPPINNIDENEIPLIFSEEHPEKMGNSELDQLLKNYLKEKNYRFAIRILYLIILKQFSETRIIRWNKEKTNRNYIYELSGTPVQQDFSKLTLFYDIAWYGDHDISEYQFEEVYKIAEGLLNASKPSSTERI